MKKRFLTLMLGAVMLLGTAMPVSAANYCECYYKKVPIGTVIYRCNGDLYKSGEVVSHTYNWLTKTCVFDVYKATSREMCSKCWYTYRYFDPHECMFKHYNCGKGNESICAVGEQDPWDMVQSNSREEEK